MINSALENAVVALREETALEIADTRQKLLESYRLRYQVYCVERSFLTGQDGLETDGYDDFGHHAVLRLRNAAMVVGTVRLVLPKVPAGGDDFPIQHLCDPMLLAGLPLATCGEVSRFALAKQSRNQSPSCSAIMRLALMKGVVMMSAEARHTHWLAVMEPTLLRLLAATGIHMNPLGPVVDYHGLRQPTVAEIVPTLTRCAVEQPIVWDFITNGGKLYPESRPRRLTQIRGDVPRQQLVSA
jgi:N-acyl-L-homoserine lactone synthetase